MPAAAGTQVDMGEVATKLRFLSQDRGLYAPPGPWDAIGFLFHHVVPRTRFRASLTWRQKG